ncbi:hypothetical protein BOTBODRAFT_34903 [Botryobasidium botryosum FD-172 SS1]|uniref:NAD-dependent protein deacetylase n=1 Tax=Botryobasidium botryosum (strain FD-172 SS1) TaxID=930990 RepID=A0A067MJH6_BOTB1|nr:hypothetical protein BOTBODRAFT_34903 [Botryobasidium botryosum FD-172 SS1]
MGAAQSFEFNDDPPKILEAKDLAAIASYIKSGKCKNVFIMAGAGISTAAGIPDFRSPDTGIYSNLEKLGLPNPEAVFDIQYFRIKPEPFYELARELAPGKFKPTLTHAFIRLLHEKSLLHTCFTQNIDTLERRAGVPPDKLVEAHGSFATQRCIDCREPYPDDDMADAIRRGVVPVCLDPSCGGLVKPDIVFFGESLPPNFHSALPALQTAEDSLAIVLGTSLKVRPFALLPEMVPETSPRLLINLDHVGSFGSRTDDVIVLAKCDEGVIMLCRELGWEDELKRLWNEAQGGTAEQGPEQEKEKEKEKEKEQEAQGHQALAKEDKNLESDMDQLVKDAQRALAIGDAESDKARIVEPLLEVREELSKQEEAPKDGVPDSDATV